MNPTLGNTGPRPGFRRVVGVVKTPTKEAPLGADDGLPTLVARRTCASTGLNPDARRPSTGRLAPTPTPTPTRLRGRAYAQAPVGPAASAARHPRQRVRGRTVATDNGEPPPSPNRDWAARPPRLPPPARLCPSGPVRGRDRPIGFHHLRISPGRFESRVGGM